MLLLHSLSRIVFNPPRARVAQDHIDRGVAPCFGGACSLQFFNRFGVSFNWSFHAPAPMFESMRESGVARAKEISPGFYLSKIRRVLHATDLNPVSNKALSLAIDLAQQNDADLVLMHALPPPTPLYEIDSPYRTEAEEALAALAKRVSKRGITAKRVLVKGTDPVPRAISRCAKFFNVDLIVMGTGRRTGIARYLTGSMVAKVIREAPCPVLVVKR